MKLIKKKLYWNYLRIYAALTPIRGITKSVSGRKLVIINRKHINTRFLFIGLFNSCVFFFFLDFLSQNCTQNLDLASIRTRKGQSASNHSIVNTFSFSLQSWSSEFTCHIFHTKIPLLIWQQTRHFLELVFQELWRAYTS